MVNCLVFSICHVRLCKRWCLQNFYSVKRNGLCWKSLIRMFWQCLIIWYLSVGFKTIILCSIHSIRLVKICFLQKYNSWKPQLELWNTNHESLVRAFKTGGGGAQCTGPTVLNYDKKNPFLFFSFFLMKSFLSRNMHRMLNKVGNRCSRASKIAKCSS